MADLQTRIERELVAAAGRSGRLRYARSPLPRPGVIVSSLVVLLLAAGAVFAAAAPDRVDETVATPAVHTVRIVPEPTPEPITGPPLVVRPRVVENDAALFAAAHGNGTLERTWAVPGMRGEKDAHVFLYRRDNQYCLNVPSPGPAPGNSGVTCAPPDSFERFGVSLTFGSNYAAVVPDPARRPMFRHADGSRQTLEPVDGLVALARTEPGSAVALYAPDGKRRTDTFREDQRGKSEPLVRHECSNGESVVVPARVKFKQDPCTRWR